MASKTNRKKVSIRLKLGLSILILAYVPFLTVSIFSILYLEGLMIKNIETRLSNDLLGKTAKIEDMVDKMSFLAQGIGFNNTATQNFVNTLFEQKGQEDLLRKMAVQSEFESIRNYFVRSVKRIFFIAKARDNRGIPAGKIVFSAKKDTMDDPSSIVEDTFGFEESFKGALQLSNNRSHPISQIFQKADPLNKIMVHDFDMGEDGYSFYISVPISANHDMGFIMPYMDGRLLTVEDADSSQKETSMGMVIIQVSADYFNNVVGDYVGIGETVIVGTGSSNQVILHSQSQLLKTENGLLYNQGQELPDDYKRFLSTNVINGSGDFIELSTSLKIDGLGWNLVGLVDKVLFMAPVSKLKIFFTLFGVAGLIIILIMIAIISNSFASPLRRISSSLTHIKENGDFSKRTQIKRFDEIGQAVHSVNGLMEALQTILKEVNLVMSATARGDLSQRVTGDLNGELGDLKDNVNESINMLSLNLSKIINSIQHLQESTNAVAIATADLSDGAIKQAGSIEEISSSMEEVEVSTKENYQRSYRAEKLASEALKHVDTSNKEMKNLQGSMDKISATGMDMSNVIKVINDIAFQTNLLALNAAVEAARAGQHGKGFSVVAQEVRSLSNRCAEAASETARLIESSIQEVTLGVEKTNQVALNLEKVVNHVNNVNDIIKQIATVSQQQSSGIVEINQGLSNVNQIVQQNASIAQDLNQWTQTLASEADTLQATSNQFSFQDCETDKATVLALTSGR